jgi:hypothetical protein
MIQDKGAQRRVRHIPRLSRFAVVSVADLLAAMSKRFLTDVIQQSSGLTDVAPTRVVADLIATIKAEIIENGRFSLPDFGAFPSVRCPSVRC